MRRWATHADAAFDTRVGRLELWCVERGYFRVANLLAKVRVWCK